MPGQLEFTSALQSIKRHVRDSVPKLRAEVPQASDAELRASVIRSMRKALVFREEDGEAGLRTLLGEKTPSGKYSGESLMTLSLSTMVVVMRRDFGVDTTDLVAQESLMALVQNALFEELPPS